MATRLELRAHLDRLKALYAALPPDVGTEPLDRVLLALQLTTLRMARINGSVKRGDTFKAGRICQ